MTAYKLLQCNNVSSWNLTSCQLNKVTSGQPVRGCTSGGVYVPCTFVLTRQVRLRSYVLTQVFAVVFV